MGLAANSYASSPTVASLSSFLTTGVKTVALIDCGVVQQVTAAAHVITLPATAASLTFTVSNGQSDGNAVTISPQAADKISGGGITPADDKDLINTAATAKRGDYVKLLADGVDGYTIIEKKGIWARQA